MSPTKRLIGQILVVFAIVVAGVWTATQWCAAMLGYQAQLGSAWFQLGGMLALTAKQQFQIQSLMASQFRAEAIEQARRGQIEREARDATHRFLGDGKVYSPLP